MSHRIQNEEDQNREGINFTKIVQLFRLLRPRNTKTLARLQKFTDLDLDKIQAKTGVEIKGIIVDVDDTISYQHGKILEENVKHIKNLRSQGVKFAVLSNMKRTSRYDVIENDAIILTNFPAKPDPRGFEEACKKLQLPKKNIVMVGDNYVTDGGAIRAGINFVYVKPIKLRHASLPQRIHSMIRAFFIGISKIHDLGRKKPIVL